MHYFAPMTLSHCSVKRRLNVETSNTVPATYFRQDYQGSAL